MGRMEFRNDLLESHRKRLTVRKDAAVEFRDWAKRHGPRHRLRPIDPMPSLSTTDSFPGRREGTNHLLPLTTATKPATPGIRLMLDTGVRERVVLSSERCRPRSAQYTSAVPAPTSPRAYGASPERR